MPGFAAMQQEQRNPAASQVSTALYIRLSVEDTRKQKSGSVENQISCLREFMAGHPELRLYQIYQDIDVSGATFDRPAFSRMMDDINAGRVGCILVRDLSRFGRNYLESGAYIEQIFPLLGVRFIAVNDQYDSLLSQEGEKVGLALKNVLNDITLRDISQKIKSSYRVRQQEGDYLGALPPYGYLKNGENRYRLVPDPVTAPVVRQIFRWKEAGWGDGRIAAALNEQEILPPQRYRYEIGLVHSSRFADAGYWYKSAVRRILQNPVYQGDTVQNRFPAGPASRTQERQASGDKTDWIIVPDTHQALISRACFRAVQEMIEKRRHCSTRNHPRKESADGDNNPLKGLVFCEKCGKPMLRRKFRKENTVRYSWLCSTHEDVSRHLCQKNRINDEILMQILHHILRHFLELPGYQKRSGRQPRPETPNTPNPAVLKREIAMLKGEKRRIYEAYTLGQYSREAYCKESGRLEQAAAKKELLLKQEIRGSRTDGEQGGTILLTRQDNPVRPELLRLFVQAVSIKCCEHIKVTLRFQQPVK